MLQKLTYNFRIALDAIIQNKLRSFLTSLGIIFGVASVISMMAIGEGAKVKILEQMKLLGTRNIIINPIFQSNEDRMDSGEELDDESMRWSPGLTLADGEGIKQIIPLVEQVSPEIVLDYAAIVPGRKMKAKVVGVSANFFESSGFELQSGSTFLRQQQEDAEPVCVIGFGVAARLFPNENPLGKQLKCGKNWLTIVGVARDRDQQEINISGLEIRDQNFDIYIPVSTFLLRFKNRAKISKKDLQRAAQRRTLAGEDGSTELKDMLNYHQLDKLVVTVTESKHVRTVAEVLERMLYRRHNKKKDFEIIVPEVLLKQEQETTREFNLLLSAIASISLLVGGIGIMNIMLASVMERIKEIGVRLSLGATKRDIISQFLSEAVTLSVTGGLIGILLGILFGVGINYFSDTTALISPFSILLSFFVSITIGLIFGIFPARKAAKQDPVISLRHE